jgi:predicted TIM-barrel fold metal-dependent hydrolase
MENALSAARIDVHTHLVPPFWAKDLPDHGGDPSGWDAPEWSPEKLLAFMDEEEIAVSMLSLTAPGIEGWQGADRIEMARRVNDYGAGLVRDHPDRFGYLATLSLPDVDAGLAEIRRSYDDLGVDGICLHSNFEHIYLGDDRFLPIWEELDRRSATVFVHPTTPEAKVLPGIPGPIEDYPADTTRTALHLVVAGHMSRFRRVRIILSHGGGFLPYAASRFAELTSSLNPDRSATSLLDEMGRFYFDTALVAPSGLPSLLAFGNPGHILFGTDYPYASTPVSKTFTRGLDDAEGLSAEKLSEINIGARALFERPIRADPTFML